MADHASSSSSTSSAAAAAAAEGSQNDMHDGMTLSESTAQLEAKGFAGQFSAIEDGAIRCLTCHQTSDAADVTLIDLRRTEGASDPDDMVAIAALTCPKCNALGTLVVHYGPEATPEEQDALRLLSDGR